MFLYCLRKTLAGESVSAPQLNDVRNYERSDVELARYERLAARKLDPMSPVIARLRPKVQMEIAQTNPGVVTVKTHNAFMSDRGNPLINPSASAGAIYLVRNPLDVAISNAELRNQDIDTTIGQMARSGFAGWGKDTAYWVSGSWSENVKSWTDPPHSIVLVLRYEDMVQSPTDAFRKVANHLRLSPTPAQLSAAVGAASFDLLRTAELSQGFAERPAKAHIFFRQGRVGEWRDRLSTEQVSRIVNAHHAMMAKFNYLPD